MVPYNKIKTLIELCPQKNKKKIWLLEEWGKKKSETKKQKMVVSLRGQSDFPEYYIDGLSLV